MTALSPGCRFMSVVGTSIVAPRRRGRVIPDSLLAPAGGRLPAEHISQRLGLRGGLGLLLVGELGGSRGGFLRRGGEGPGRGGGRGVGAGLLVGGLERVDTRIHAVALSLDFREGGDGTPLFQRNRPNSRARIHGPAVQAPMTRAMMTSTTISMR